MNVAAALIYWIIIALWLAVLGTISVAIIRNTRTFGTIRLLLAVLAIDTLRNIAENFYFGLYFGSKFGFFSATISEILGHPTYLLLPKVMNVFAACAVLLLLVLRWLPMASKERAKADSEIRSATEALSKEAEERKRLFETSLDLILVTDRHGVFLRVSPSSYATIGYKPEEMVGRSGKEFILSEDLDSTRHEMRLARNGHSIQNFEARYVHKNGNIVPLAWCGVWSEPEQKHFFFGRDMTEQKRSQEDLRRLAHFDGLTNLPNRTSLQADFDTLFDRQRSCPLTLVIFDLDGFKDINDTLGHSIGDKFLQAVAKRMLAAAEDFQVYRLGGDEFVLVIPECGDVLIVSDIVDRILKRLTGGFQIQHHTLFVAASAGVAIAPADGWDLDGLLANADLALYDAKAAGGGSRRFFVPTLRAKANARRALDSELRRACANGEFVLYFQPQYRTSDAKLIGAEALLRWQHPEKGLLAPGLFLEALEKSAVVLDVGEWILLNACQTAARWRSMHAPNFKVAVNLFPAQFRQSALLDDVGRALTASGLPPNALELEITENVALEQSEAMKLVLESLRQQGVGLALDDFGTGYASLSYLTRYPLTKIKIDRSFVQKIEAQSESHDTAIVRSIITMAHNLGLQVTAEGVETQDQWRFLREKGCHEIQGFLFSKPLAADAVERLLLIREDDARELSGN
jgi:diguanylate cyclase (GGDEF)-like protein/PAS domain S-box-containing protein